MAKIQQHCKTACFIVYVRSAASELTRSGHTKSDRFPDTKDGYERRFFGDQMLYRARLYAAGGEHLTLKFAFAGLIFLMLRMPRTPAELLLSRAVVRPALSVLSAW